MGASAKQSAELPGRGGFSTQRNHGHFPLREFLLTRINRHLKGLSERGSEGWVGRIEFELKIAVADDQSICLRKPPLKRIAH
jgi:hypothetical protein